MNDWDNIIKYEENVYNKSKIEGMNDTKEAYEEGKQTGFQNGFALGVELSYMKEMILHILNKIDDNDRIKSRCHQIIEKIEIISEENNDQIDFIQQLKEIQSLYRSIGPLAIPLISKPSDSVDW